MLWDLIEVMSDSIFLLPFASLLLKISRKPAEEQQSDSPAAADSGELEDLTAECRGREGDGGKRANIWLSGSGPTLRC